jgi:hypothetical protein
MPFRYVQNMAEALCWFAVTVCLFCYGKYNMER